MTKGFRDFLLRGNVVDLAVGVVIGAAFASIVDSLVADVITPAIGMLGGVPDFSAWMVGPIRVGSFLNAVLAFVLKAAGVYFLIVVPFMRFFRRAEPTPVAMEPPKEVLLLGEIRDLLREQEAHASGPH